MHTQARKQTQTRQNDLPGMRRQESFSETVSLLRSQRHLPCSEPKSPMFDRRQTPAPHPCHSPANPQPLTCGHHLNVKQNRQATDAAWTAPGNSSRTTGMRSTRCFRRGNSCLAASSSRWVGCMRARREPRAGGPGGREGPCQACVCELAFAVEGAGAGASSRSACDVRAQSDRRRRRSLQRPRRQRWRPFSRTRTPPAQIDPSRRRWRPSGSMQRGCSGTAPL